MRIVDRASSGTLIVPMWPSAPFWPMICGNGVEIEPFIIDWLDLPTDRGSFTPGLCQSIFGNEDLNFRMLALRICF